MDENKSLAGDALLLVNQRNEFYKQKYRLALGIFGLSLLMMMALFAVVIYLVKNPTHPIYFAADEWGRLVQEPELTVSNISVENAAAFAVEAVEKAYSYDFVNYRRQLQDAQKYFTHYGWYSYMQGLNASNNILALTNRKMVFSAKVVDKPKLLNQGVLGKAYAWKFQMPLLVTYLTPPYDAKSKFENPLIVTIIVQRQPLLQSYRGLGVLQMIGSLAVSPAIQG